MRIIPTLSCVVCLGAGLAARASESPAQLDLRRADAALERAQSGADRAAALVEKAAAHTRRARETGDAAHYGRSLEALAAARRADPNGARADKIEAWVRLGRHEFEVAEVLASAYCAAHPDDPEAWGLLGDARMELGASEAAADAYQRMMDLRPGPSAYLRAAHWRERAGDLAGARDLLRRAFTGMGARDAEDRAWTLVQLAAISRREGDAAGGEATLEEALGWFAGYHYALAALAEIHVASGRFASGEDLARRALAAAPHPERRLVLADALRGLRRAEEARREEAAFEAEALANAERADNENLFLVDFYLDRRPDPERALAIARQEAARRRDPATLERLARALVHSGCDGEARGLAGEATPAACVRGASAGQPPIGPISRSARILR